MAFNYKDWEIIGRRGGWECPICMRWWPGAQRRKCRGHCKSFQPLPAIRPILRKRDDGKVIRAVAGQRKLM